MQVKRFETNPIIVPNMDGRMGDNINGPSLLRVPDWLPRPLGRYYLYFAHHQGTYIRMAYADRLAGPWEMHTPGVLDLADSHCQKHVASPDVHVDDDRREIRMYYHGPFAGSQVTRVALSADGLAFTARPEVLGRGYFRVWVWRGRYYAVTRGGLLYRSHDALSGFEPGPSLFGGEFRHAAVVLDGDVLGVYCSLIGDCPEHIVVSRVVLGDDWKQWRAEPPRSVLKPQTHYEGADLPAAPSRGGWAKDRVRQLRDPAIYRENGRTYLVYSVAGEHGLAIAELLRDE